MTKELDFFAEEGAVLLIDKPLKWTSFDVVNKIRYAGKFKKVGHAGTLDPLATGLLILCSGKKTKSIEQYQAQKKEYTGTILLGKTTPSFDLETKFDQSFEVTHITRELVEEVLENFKGEIEQIPPVFSAIKVKGKRAYESAREGKALELKSRKITIEEFEVDLNRLPEVDFRIVCSKGTYIRSIARDLGKALGSGGTLIALRRTKIGDFSVSNAMQVDEAVAEIRKQSESIS
jgi:tRNA pseudouridine55 synthase